MLRMLHVPFLLLLLLGQMVIWFKMTSLPVCAAGAGVYSEHSSAVWARGSCGHLDDVGIREGSFFVLFLELCRPYREPKSGVLFLPWKLVLLIISVVTISMSFDMSVKSWVALRTQAIVTSQRWRSAPHSKGDVGQERLAVSSHH